MSGRNSRRSSKSFYSSPKSPIPINPVTSPVINQVQQPGFFSNVLQGFGLGVGQSIAMNIFRTDPKIIHVNENISSSATIEISESLYDIEFKQCMKDKMDDKEVCKQYVQCLKDSNNTKSKCSY